MLSEGHINEESYFPRHFTSGYGPHELLRITAPFFHTFNLTQHRGPCPGERWDKHDHSESRESVFGEHEFGGVRPAQRSDGIFRPESRHHQ